jgi:sarcosine oxidase subunit gamma
MDTKDYSEIKISEVEPIIKINLRGKNKDFITKIGKELSIILPTDSNTSSGNDKLNILWLSPDEWLIYSNDKIDPKSNNSLEDKLFNEISIVKLGAVTNVTDHWVMINLKGKNVFELLSTGCPFNFNNFKNSKGAVIQTILNHTDVIIHNKDINDLNLFVRRSFSNHLWSWINDSSRFI